MKILPHAQGSVDWAIARSGIPTASEFDNIVTPEFKVRTGDMWRSYLAKKTAEAWTGGPLATFNTMDMEQGRILEAEAIPFYELTTGVTVQRVGLCLTDDGRIGCSPDGLIGDDSGLEVKCPEVHTHVRYLLEGGLPKCYAAQIHGSMFVTGRTSWTFMSYRRMFPPLIVRVERNEGVMKLLGDALSLFLRDLETSMCMLEEVSGGPPPRFTQSAEPLKTTGESPSYIDIIP